MGSLGFEGLGVRAQYKGYIGITKREMDGIHSGFKVSCIGVA